MSNPINTCCKVSFLANTPIKVHNLVIPNVNTLEDVLHVITCHDNIPKDSTVSLLKTRRLDETGYLSVLRVRSCTGETWEFSFTYEFLEMVL
jgi:hypothetical protein